MNDSKQLDDLLEQWAATLISIAPQMPTYDDMQAVVEGLQPAIERGYFAPDEDERIRELFVLYLKTRAGLHALLRAIRPYALQESRHPTERRHDVFLLAFCTACLLMRMGKYLVDSFRHQSVVWRKLDEPEPCFGVPPRQFTAVYRSLTSPRNIWTFLSGIQHFQENRESVLAYRESPQLDQVVGLLKAEEPFIETSKRYYATGGIKYRWHSFLLRNHSGFKKFTFGLFRVSGSLIAELRWKWKRKRVLPAVQKRIASTLIPGDVIVTRHDDAASNLFLPGFWPHGALYLGTIEQRRKLIAQVGLPLDPLVSACPAPQCVLEARKDGVLYRELEDTLAVDACVVVRPKLEAELLCKALARAMTHQGKGYDFEFDFRRSDKLVCTEVIYRAYHGLGPMSFNLTSRAGRLCLSAEDLLDTAVDGSLFDVVLIYGVDQNQLVEGELARNCLAESYRSRRKKNGVG